MDLLEFCGERAREITVLIDNRALFLLTLIAELRSTSRQQLLAHVGWSENLFDALWNKLEEAELVCDESHFGRDNPLKLSFHGLSFIEAIRFPPEVASLREVVAPNFGVPEPLRNDATLTAGERRSLRQQLDHIADNPSLSYTERRKLLKIETIGRCQLLKNEMDSRIGIEQARLAKSEAVALAAISAYGDNLIYQIRDEFTKTIRKWGLRVNVEQLQLLAEFGESLTTFKAELRTRGLEEQYKQYMLKSADRAFEMVAERLGNLAGRMFDAVHNPTEGSEFNEKPAGDQTEAYVDATEGTDQGDDEESKDTY